MPSFCRDNLFFTLEIKRLNVQIIRRLDPDAKLSLFQPAACCESPPTMTESAFLS
jgi:hypothetical protein